MSRAIPALACVALAAWPSEAHASSPVTLEILLWFCALPLVAGAILGATVVHLGYAKFLAAFVPGCVIPALVIGATSRIEVGLVALVVLGVIFAAGFGASRLFKGEVKR